jgi:HK97 family phage major capsid protein
MFDEAQLVERLTSIKSLMQGYTNSQKSMQSQLDGIDVKLRDRSVASPGRVGLKELLENNESVKALMDKRAKGATFQLEGHQVNQFLERKTTITTSVGTGFATPGVLSIQQIPGITLEARQALKVRDVLYQRPTTAGLVYFVKVNSPMTIASPVVEGNVKPENAITFTSLSERIKTIATWIPASKQVLDDFEELSGLIQSTMPYYVNLEEELQLLSGDGTGENLHGLIVQAAPFNTGFLIGIAGWNKIDVIGRAIQQIAVAKEIPPTFVILNPTDWWGIRLTKDSFGRYILGDPEQPFTNPNIFGLTVVSTTSIPSGTFLVGSGDPAASEIRDRMEVQVDISTENSDYFTRNLVAIRAEERLALVVKRPFSYVSGTFTTSP